VVELACFVMTVSFCRPSSTRGAMIWPPSVSCATSGGGISAQAAVTAIRSYGARAAQPRPPIAKDQNNVRVSSALEVLPGECVCQWIDLDRRDLAAVADHFTRDGGAVAGAGADLEEPVAESQPQRLVEQGVAVRAGD